MDDRLITFLFGFIAALFFCLIFLYPTHVKQGYKQGQIDAINGNIKYHKVTHKDSTVTWEEIKQ